MAYTMACKSVENNSCRDIMDEELVIGPVISQNACKVLDECIQTMLASREPSNKEINKDRVRRPMNAFMIYSQTARKAVAKHYPTLSYRKLSKALGQIWKNMDPEEKKPFIKEAEKRRLLHKKEHPHFKFTTYKKRNAKGKVPEKKETNCGQIMDAFSEFIQNENSNQYNKNNGAETEKMVNRNLANANNFGSSTMTSCANNIVSYNTFKPEQFPIDHETSLKMLHRTCTTFDSPDDNIFCPTIQTWNDNDLVSLLDACLRETPPSLLTASSLKQYPAQNDAFSAMPKLNSYGLPYQNFAVSGGTVGYEFPKMI